MKTWGVVWVGACLLSLLGTLGAQEAKPYQPKLKNSKTGEWHDFPMGVLSATGRIKDGEKEILIQHVGVGGAVEKAGLRAGDRVVVIHGRRPKAFSKRTETGVDGALATLGLLLDEQAGKTGNLRLAVQRGEEDRVFEVAIPKAPAFGKDLATCPKRKKFLANIAAHLNATQEKNGRWRPGVGGDADVYMSAFCGLTLLASNNKDYLPAIKHAVDFLRKKHVAQIDPEDPKVGPKNWQACSTAIFLAEYQLATGDKSYFEDMVRCCNLLAQRVTDRGTMGHHFEIPYNGGGLVVINTQAHIAWALAEKCGYKLDRGAWDRSVKEIKASVDKKTGAIGYSSRAPGSPDISARTGAMAVALMLKGEEKRWANELSDALVKHHGRMRHAHAMTSIGLIYGFAGIRCVDERDHLEVMKKWQPYLELSRTSAGSAAFFGGKRNIGGDEYLGLEPIGNAMVGLVLASVDGRLHLHGGTKREWFGK